MSLNKIRQEQGRTTWLNQCLKRLLCQITSNPYSDSQAIEITPSDLKKGALNRVSFVRTYLGGSALDQGSKIAVDTVGNAYITGYVGSLSDAFALKIAPGGLSPTPKLYLPIIRND